MNELQQMIVKLLFWSTFHFTCSIVFLCGRILDGGSNEN